MSSRILPFVYSIGMQESNFLFRPTSFFKSFWFLTESVSACAYFELLPFILPSYLQPALVPCASVLNYNF